MIERGLPVDMLLDVTLSEPSLPLTETNCKPARKGVYFACFQLCMMLWQRGFPQPLADPPDGLDIVQLEQLAYCLSQWASLSRQPKDNQDIYKRFLFHYSRTQEATHPIKTGFPPVHPLMHLAAKLATRRMKRFLQRGSGTAAVDFTKKDHAATWGRPFFLFRPRNGRNTEDEAQ
ncbi:neuromedin-S isoform X1 [Rhinopithecus roxellana]|uniref:neuromedin-S isoform X1 n=1 Tax=Rhinopithecus roxellana TaxID=61622 RepID=UPI0012378622|nr:neuromedin-S isoform X1 [Rhinopithecus roxellana]XP_030777388.1 neuromedin-S isoform X1 [Rhinopithecus roxellana]